MTTKESLINFHESIDNALCRSLCEGAILHLQSNVFIFLIIIYLFIFYGAILLKGKSDHIVTLHKAL